MVTPMVTSIISYLESFNIQCLPPPFLPGYLQTLMDITMVTSWSSVPSKSTKPRGHIMVRDNIISSLDSFPNYGHQYHLLPKYLSDLRVTESLGWTFNALHALTSACLIGFSPCCSLILYNVNILSS